MVFKCVVMRFVCVQCPQTTRLDDADEFVSQARSLKAAKWDSSATRSTPSVFHCRRCFPCRRCASIVAYRCRYSWFVCSLPCIQIFTDLFSESPCVDIQRHTFLLANKGIEFGSDIKVWRQELSASLACLDTPDMCEDLRFQCVSVPCEFNVWELHMKLEWPF